MKKMLLISLLLAWPTTTIAAADVQCDAKPFTLNKPKPPSKPAVETVKAKPVPPKPVPKAGTQAKTKPIADCKEPKKG